ncbi:peptide deformylase [bacterium]|nr:peptide deformylase [bacterium]
MKLEILKYPDPRLSLKAQPVDKFDGSLHQLLNDMAETMYAAEGIGLAAPQVGKSLRLFVVDLGEHGESSGKLMEFINPVLSRGEGTTTFEEGCLSVPGVTEEVDRFENITISFQDRNGKAQEMMAQGLLAVALQHENDHLDGVLFVEKLSPMKRRLIKKKLQKAVTL